MQTNIFRQHLISTEDDLTKHCRFSIYHFLHISAVWTPPLQQIISAVCQKTDQQISMKERANITVNIGKSHR